MRRHRSVWGVLAVAVLVVVTGCGQQGALVDDLTPQQAEAETTRLVAEAVAMVEAIDPTVIRRIDDVTNESRSCRGTDVDPDGTVQQWAVQRNVQLVEGSPQLDIANTVIDTYLDKGWVASIDRESTGEGGRYVQLLRDGKPGETFGLSFTAGANDPTSPPVIFVRSGSPCYLDPER